MTNLGKFSVASLLIGMGFLLIDLFLCIIALAAPGIGADEKFQLITLGFLITGLSVLSISCFAGIINFIKSI